MGRKTLPIRDRLDANYVAAPNGCFIWTGYRNDAGYGILTVLHKPKRAHKLWYELVNGPVPEGLELDHLCRDRACIRVEHLEAVTHRVNSLRGDGMGSLNARRTHCKRGHDLRAPDAFKFYGKLKAKECRRCRLLKYNGGVRTRVFTRPRV